MFFDNIPFILRGYVILGGLKIGCSKSTESFIDIKSVGIYAGAYNLMSMPFTMVQTVIERTLRPVYFEAVSNGNAALADRYYNIWIISVLAICAAGVTLAFLFSDFIVRLCLASEYHASTVFMPWIALGHLFLAISKIFETRCLAWKKSGYVLVIQTSGAVFSVLAVIPLVKAYGASGAAWAVPIYFGAQLVIAYLINSTLLPLKKKES